MAYQLEANIYDSSNDFGLLNQLGRSLSVTSGECVGLQGFQAFADNNEKYPYHSSDKVDNDPNCRNLQIGQELTLAITDNTKKTSEAAIFSTKIALTGTCDAQISTDATSTNEQANTASNGDEAHMEVEIDDNQIQQALMQRGATLSEQQNDDDMEDETRKKVHLNVNSKPDEEIGRLEAIVYGCGLLSSHANISTNYMTYMTREDATIKIKLPNKRGRPRKNLIEKSLSQSLEDYLKKSANKFDEIWFKDNAEFASFMTFPENLVEADRSVNHALGTNSSQGKTSKKRKQNDNRNIPALVWNRVIESILSVLNSNNHNEYKDRYFYIIDILIQRCCETEDRNNLTQYLTNCKIKDKTCKTWKSMQSKIDTNSTNPESLFYGEIFFACIDSFLSESGQEDFDVWLNGPDARLQGKSKKVLCNEKKRLRSQFKGKIKFCF